MALLFQEKKDGIQLGKSSDKCFLCEKEARQKRETIQEGLLENKEVFLLGINGLRHCLCINHFKDLLGDYTLIAKKDNEEVTNLLAQLKDMSQATEASSTEIVNEVDNKDIKSKTEEKEEEKKSAKTTKAAKSSKGK